MTPLLASEPSVDAPPDHTQLPDKDGSITNNYQAHLQSRLLTGSLRPHLERLHPDGQFSIGCDSGIYWKHTKEPLDGCKAPDWFYVPGVPPMLDGTFRRSYVLWKEGIRPLIVIEYVSGDGSEEHDTTPGKGKFWVYEQGIAAPYYAIFDVAKPSVELYRLEGGRYMPVPANAAGRFLVAPLKIELGILEGKYQGMDLPWLRVWDAETGQLLPSTEERELANKQRADEEKRLADETASLLAEAREDLQAECERAEKERKRAEDQAKLAETERKRAEALAAKLLALGIDPNAG